MMQATSDIYLGWSKGLQADRYFYWRQLRDMKASADIENMSAFALGFYARLCGWTLARGHARSGDAIAMAEYLGPDDTFERAIADFSEAYAAGRLASSLPYAGTERCAMTESIDELGPVDYLVVEFPGSNFNGEILPELVDLVQRGVVRVLDLVVIKKQDDGSFDAFEFDDIEQGLLGELRGLERELADLLTEDDVSSAAEALEPGSTAALLVYENRWAARFAGAVRRSGGQLVAGGRIPMEAVLEAIGSIEVEVDDAEQPI